MPSKPGHKLLENSVRLAPAVGKAVGRDMRIWLRRFLSAIKQGHIYIQDRDDGSIVQFVPRFAQRRLLRLMIQMADEGIPIRILVPKSRRQGISTLIQALFAFLGACIENFNAVTVAHTEPASQDIFKLAKASATRMPNAGIDRVSAKAISFNNGSEYTCVTAGAKGVSRGGTIHALHLSEVASYQSVSGMDTKALSAIMNTVALSPSTIIVMESTGEGPTGEFYNRCFNANAKPDGQGDDGYRLLFLPWHFDEDAVADPIQNVLLSQDDRALQQEFKLKDSQLWFWKRKYFEAVAGGSHAFFFSREWPSRFTDCFTGASGLVYPGFGAKNIRSIHHDVFVGASGTPVGNWRLYRAIDWGWASDPFACLWIAHDPDGPPLISVDPSCENLIKEFYGYKFDQKRDKPMDTMNHAMDALRYAVITFNLTGTTHIYRELYQRNAVQERMDGMARIIHEMSGWMVPVGENDLARIVPYPGKCPEVYAGTVADRSQPQTIVQFCRWGIPCIGQTRPAVGTKSRGEILDGISKVSTLVGGASRLDNAPDTRYISVLDASLAAVTGRDNMLNRPCSISPENHRIVEEFLATKQPTPYRPPSLDYAHLYL